MWFPHLILLLLLYTFGPGMLLVRPLRLAPAERLVVAIGIGLFVDYICSFCIFALQSDPHMQVVTSAVAFILGVLAWRDWADLLRSHQVRRLLVCWATLLVWGFILLSAIRSYGGGTWGGDWREHYERSRFFQGGVPLDFKFIEHYPLPMRPPMMNAIAGGMLAQVWQYDNSTTDRPDFQAFQIAFLFLNSLVFLPCALVIPRLVKLVPRLARKVPWTLTAVFAASPMVSQNLTYSWTKLLAAFYAVLAIAVYLRGWRRPENTEGGTQKAEGGQQKAKADYFAPSTALPFFIPPASSVRYILVFSLLCIGFLVHFSVGPYALFLGLHYLIAVFWKRPKKFVEAGSIALASALVLSTWFVWSVANYGASVTFGSTSAVSDAAVMTPGENAENIPKNLFNTLVPTIIRRPGLVFQDPQSAVDENEQPATADGKPVARTDDEASRLDLFQLPASGQLRDFFFLIYQVSVPGALGLAGLPIALVLGWMSLSGRLLTRRPIRGFWIAFVPTVFVLGVATYGGKDRFGVAHVSLQPLILLGLSFIAGGVWLLPVRVRGVLLIGLLADFVLGVFLQVTLQHRLIQMEPIKAYGPEHEERLIAFRVIQTPDTPSRAAQNNFREKVEAGMIFWGDHFGDGLPALQAAMGGLLAFTLFKGLAAPRWRRSKLLRLEPPKDDLSKKARTRGKGRKRK